MAARKARRAAGRAAHFTSSVPTLLASETWTGSNGAAWGAQWTTAANSGTIDIQSNKGRQLTTATGFSNGPRALLSGMAAVADVNAAVFFTVPSADGGVFTFLSVRADAYAGTAVDPTNGYTLIAFSGTDLWIRRSVAGSNSDVTAQAGFISAAVGDVIGMRFQVEGQDLKAKIWNQTAGAEPGAWNIEVTDAGGPSAAGKIGLAVFNSSAFVHSVLWDDLTVYTVAAAPPVVGSIFLDLGFAGGTIVPPWDDIEAANLPRQCNLVTSPVRTQAYACYFEQAPGDVWINGSVRSMLGYYYPAENGFDEGDDYYFAFSMRFPVDYIYNGTWELHQRSQIYNVDGDLSLAPHALMQTGGDLEYRLMTGCAMWVGGQWTRYEYYGAGIHLLDNYPLNTWIDFIIRVKFAKAPADGRLQIWRRVGTDAWPTVPASSYTTVGTNSNQYFDPGPVPTLQWIPAFNNQYFGHTNSPSITSDIFSDLYPQVGIYSGSGSVSAVSSVIVDGWRCATTYEAAMAAFPTPH